MDISSQFLVGGIWDSLMEINGFRVVSQNFTFFLGGAGVTVILTVLSVFFGMILGLFLGLGKLSHKSLIYGFSTIYIDFFRGTPLFVQILLLHFGILPMFINSTAFVSGGHSLFAE